MRSYRLAAAAVGLLAVGACGGDGGGGPSNAAPTAKFSIACTLLDCTFTDASTDSDGSVASYEWNFGESGSGSNTATDQNTGHTYAAAGAYHVTLKVTDDKGLASSVADSLVTVSDVAGNTNPTADFTFSCTGLACTFTDGSSDADLGDAVASWAWDFGESGSATNTSTDQNPNHTYAFTDPTTAQVTLTVTDNNGGTGSVTKDVAVTPPGGLTCDNGSGTFVGCALDLTSKSMVTITLASEDCNADGNTLAITSPIQETVFTDGCHTTAGTAVTINGGAAFDAGTQLEAQMTSGSVDPNRIPPAVHVTGTFPDWTLSFDDGEDPTGPGEPDFNDLILTVHATVVP
jgi:PKD repeat protein